MIEILSSLRFIAAIAIYFHHLNFPGGLGVVCVTFFFVLSGFTMAIGYHNKFDVLRRSELRDFYTKRLIRIYPSYALTALLSIPMMLITGFDITLYNSLTTLFMAQSYFPSGREVFAFNGTTWFIANVVFYYLLTPFILNAIHKLKIESKNYLLIATLTILFLTALVIAYQFRDQISAYSVGWWFVYISPFFRIFDYTAGLIAGILFCNLDKSSVPSIKSALQFTLLEIGSICFLLFAWKYTYLATKSFQYGLCIIPPFVLIFIVFAHQKGIISYLLSGKILVHLGNLSFQIFLTHQLVIAYTAIFFMPTLYGYTDRTVHLVAQIILFIVVVSLSDTLQRYFEIPVTNRLKKRFS